MPTITRKILGTKLTATFEGSYAGEKLRKVKVSRIAYNPEPPVYKSKGARTNLVAVFFEMEFVRTPRKKSNG